MGNSKRVPASQRSNKTVPPRKPGETQGLNDNCIIVRNINDTHVSRSEEAKFTGSSPSFPRQVCWRGKKRERERTCSKLNEDLQKKKQGK